MTSPVGKWTHPSVLLLAAGNDPVESVVRAARDRLLEAVDSGWDPPPYDPFGLAAALGIPLRPVTGGFDARTVPDGTSPVGVRLEYDPGRPAGRLRFSLAHEIAHTLFPDVAEQIRNRTGTGAVETFDGPDDWQLELLCNVGAAELLMPAQTLQDLRIDGLDLRDLMRRREQLQVSTEALLRRLVTLTEKPVTMFAARRTPDGYVLDYAQTGRAGGPRLERGRRLPKGSVLRTCTGVGYTAEATETWDGTHGPLLVQAVGMPPYPGHRYPRVGGLVRPSALTETTTTHARLVEVTGDALEPEDPAGAMILHVVNDRAHAWGGEFGKRLARRHPWAAQSFRAWTVADEDNLTLGNVHFVRGPADAPAVCSLVAQEGFGPSAEPRLRYPALARALDTAGDHAARAGLTVHAPRIGTGQAGGHWDLVRDQIDRAVVRKGADVVVHRPAGR